MTDHTDRKHNTRIRQWAREIIGLADDIDGQGSTRRAIKAISKLVRDEHPAPEPTPDSTWTREERLNYRGAVTWLKRGIKERGYCADPQYIAQSKALRQEIREGIFGGGGTHAVVLIQNSKRLDDVVGDWEFDYWDDPDLVTKRLQELVGYGLQPVLLAASDKDARERGIQWVIDNINFAMKHFGHLISGVIPRIEMDEQPGAWSKADQYRVAYDTRVARDEHGVVLWAHYLSDRYYEPVGFDGILYQHRRVGEDGKFLRGPYLHWNKLAQSTRNYRGPQDLSWDSPLRSAIEHGWTFVSWEYGQRPEDTEQDCMDLLDGDPTASLKSGDRQGIKAGFLACGVEPRWG